MRVGRRGGEIRAACREGGGGAGSALPVADAGGPSRLHAADVARAHCRPRRRATAAAALASPAARTRRGEAAGSVDERGDREGRAHQPLELLEDGQVGAAVGVRRGGAGAARGAGSKRRVAATSAAVAVAVFISPGLAADAEAHLVVDLEVLRTRNGHDLSTRDSDEG